MLLAIARELFKRKSGFPVGENNSSDKSHLGIERRYGNVEGEEIGDTVDTADLIFEIFGWNGGNVEDVGDVHNRIFSESCRRSHAPYLYSFP